MNKTLLLFSIFVLTAFSIHDVALANSRSATGLGGQFSSFGFGGNVRHWAASGLGLGAAIHFDVPQLTLAGDAGFEGSGLSFSVDAKAVFTFVTYDRLRLYAGTNIGYRNLSGEMSGMVNTIFGPTTVTVDISGSRLSLGALIGVDIITKENNALSLELGYHPAKLTLDVKYQEDTIGETYLDGSDNPLYFCIGYRRYFW